MVMSDEAGLYPDENTQQSGGSVRCYPEYVDLGYHLCVNGS